jgi:DNA-binding transcriptional MerR regulator
MSETSSRGKSPATRGAELDLGTDKQFFKIGEASEIVGVPAHVLRYWETEFGTLRPQKSRGQQRVYRRSDIATLLRIKQLLYGDKFTIAGARKQLKVAASKVEMAAPNGAYLARRSLWQVKEAVAALQGFLDERTPKSAADPAGATIAARDAR